MLDSLGQNLQSQNLKTECLQPRGFRVRYGQLASRAPLTSSFTEAP